MKKILTHLQLVTKAKAIIRGEETQALFHDVNVSPKELLGFCNYLNDNLPPRKLIKVSFKNIRLTDEHIDAVKVIFPHLSALHFTNTELSEYSMNTLVNYIENPFNQLSAIHLEKNIIRPETYCRLLNVCKRNEKISKLFLNETHDYDRYNYTEMYEKFSELLIENSHIRILTMFEKSCPLKYFEALPDAIAQNKGLTHLTLGYCAYTRSSLLTRRFVNAYQQHRKIIQLEKNEISKVTKGKAALNNALDNLNEVIRFNRNIFYRLFDAIRNGDLNATRDILSSDIPFSDHCEISSGYNLLHIAVIAKENNMEMIKLLFERGYFNMITTRAKSDHFSYTPLHLAIVIKRYDIALAMLTECQPYRISSALDCAWSSGISARQMIESLYQSIDLSNTENGFSIILLKNLSLENPRGGLLTSQYAFFGKNNYVTEINQHIDSGIELAPSAQIPQEPEDRIMMEDYRNNAVILSDADDSSAFIEADFDVQIDNDIVDNLLPERIDFKPTIEIMRF